MKKYFFNKVYYQKLLIGGLAAVIFGCDNFVEIDQPNSQLITEAVFRDAATANAAMTDIYAQMREQGLISGNISGLSCLLGTYADELTSYENGIYTTAPFYTNSLSPSMTYISTIWNRTYSQLYAVNAVIEGVENSTALSQDVKKQLKGEALFVRGFLHFHLVNLYGDVPYITTTDYNKNKNAVRINTAEVNQKVIKDLNDALSLLGTLYSQTDRIRPNRFAAQAILARAYLYNNNYEEAVTMASAIINEKSLYSIATNLNNAYLKDNPSTIWQLSAGPNGVNTNQGSTFIFQAGPPSRVSLTENLIVQFEADDLRKTSWIKTITNGNSKWQHPFKYKQNNNTAVTQENSIVLRLEEQYLIRAEARTMLGELNAAVKDLNVIRTRAGLTATAAVSQNEIMKAIEHERRIELFSEFGHRFFDLKRWNQLDNVLSMKTGWNTTDSLWPLPLSEMNANPLLTPQNPGY
jgi:hypothetical protein